MFTTLALLVFGRALQREELAARTNSLAQLRQPRHFGGKSELGSASVAEWRAIGECQFDSLRSSIAM